MVPLSNLTHLLDCFIK